MVFIIRNAIVSERHRIDPLILANKNNLSTKNEAQKNRPDKGAVFLISAGRAKETSPSQTKQNNY